MIVPQNRLLIITGLIVVPLLTIFWLLPHAKGAIGLCFAVLGGLFFIDLRQLYHRRRKIKIELPGLIRVSKGRKTDMDMRCTHEFNRPLTLSFGLMVPEKMDIAMPVITAALLPESKEKTLSFSLLALKTGETTLSKVVIHIPSPMKLFSFMENKAVSTHIRIYPNLIKENRALGGLLFSKRYGTHSQRQMGKGNEFEQLREYQPGDSYEDIHWKATAKLGYPITKVFRIEQTQEIYFIIDASRLSARLIPSDENKAFVNKDNGRPIVTTILDTFIASSLALFLVTQNQGDRFGLITFNDRVTDFFKAGSGNHHYAAIRDALLKTTQKNVSPDFSELFTFLASRLRKRSLMIFLTSLDDPVLAENFSDHIHLISRQHLVMVNMLKSKGEDALFSDDPLSNTTGIYDRLAGHLFWENLKHLQRKLQSKGVDFSLLENGSMTADMVSQYMELKQRQRI